MKRPLLILCALTLVACASNPKPHQPVYETTYDCSVTETRGTLRLEADLDNVGWIERIDGVEMQARLSFINDADRAQFQRDGFSNQRFDHPILFFDYPKDLKPDPTAGYTIKGQPLENFFGGARGGSDFVQQPVASNVFLSLNWKQIQSLQSGGMMFVFLYDRSGTAHKALHFSRAHFDEIERSLKAMHSEVLAKEADKEHRCVADTHEVEQDIIIVE